MKVYLETSAVVVFLFGKENEPVKHNETKTMFDFFKKKGIIPIISFYTLHELYNFCIDNFPVKVQDEVLRLAFIELLSNRIIIKPLLKREERIAVKQHLEKIPFHEVIKLNNFFPSDNVTKLIQEFKENGTTNNELVDNPYHENAPRLFLSSIDEEKKPLEEKLKDVIQKKENKKHADKEDTILIIDNRTLTYEIEDLFLAILKLDNFLSECSFKEIWFYTGYYSNVDGEKAEYSLSPLKISEYQTEIIQKLTELNKPNEDGLFFT